MTAAVMLKDKFLSEILVTLHVLSGLSSALDNASINTRGREQKSGVERRRGLTKWLESVLIRGFPTEGDLETAQHR